MLGVLELSYLWLKAAHIIFVVFWMAGLFIFPRYLVHHQEALGRPAEAAAWVDREAKLRRIILTPSIIAVWLFGVLLASSQGWWTFTWLHLKLVIVLAMSGYHGWAVSYSKALARGEAKMPDRRLRMLNELPALGLVLIVYLVVLKPFSAG
jgi:putative membrane protein